MQGTLHPTTTPHHPDFQNHNFSADDDDSTQSSPSQLYRDLPPLDICGDNGRLSPFEPDRPDSPNHSSSAGASQDASMTLIQPFSDNSQLSDRPLNGVHPSPFEVYGDMEDNATFSR